MTERKIWIVTPSGERPPAEARRDLAEAGFDVEAVPDASGVITGEADAQAAAKARRIQGIAGTAEDIAVGVGPPGADSVWRPPFTPRPSASPRQRRAVRLSGQAPAQAGR
jgi:hypothetical protein